MQSSGNFLRRARRLTLSSALFLACLNAGCGVPEFVSFWYEEAEDEPECRTIADCNDDNKCTTDQCIENVCVRTDVSSDDGSVCTTDKCDPTTGVSHVPLPIEDDSDACTADSCDPVAGMTHVPLPIEDDGDACTTDTCEPMAGPVHTAILPEDDLDACTVDVCIPATGATDHPRVDTDDFDPCTNDGCDSATGEITHDPVPVDDSNLCTNDLCDPATGAILHTPGIICGQFGTEECSFTLCTPSTGMCDLVPQAFIEDFADNSKGWQLDMQWQIGPASSSAGQQSGSFPDPDEDYNGFSAADNGVAGVAIGGNASTTGGSTYYLTSPEIDLSSLPASETVYLDFWRWLNTAGPPMMKSNIEIWDGNAWIELWKNGGPLYDPAWNNVYYPVTTYKNAHFRVRFGLTVMNGAPVVSSWNIDHVRLIRFTDQGC